MIRVVYLVLILFVTSQICVGQDSFNLTGNGARAAGMGYTFTGLADDATAISWNPAGLTQLQSMEASVVGRFGFGSASYDFPGDIGIDDWTVETQSNFQLNFASFIVPFSAGTRNIVAGVAYRNMYDFTAYYEEMVSGPEALNLLGYNEYISDDAGGVNAVSPALAVQIADMFSVGATANIMFGTWESSITEDGFDFGTDEVTFSGLSFDIGALIKPTPQFSIGANLNLPHSVTWESPDVEFDMKVPFFFSIGAAFRATDELTLLFDYRNRSWSGTELEVDGETVELDEDLYPDANSFHVGLEYLASSGDSFIPVRIGYNTVPQLFTDYYEDAVTGHNITGGLGLILGNIILNAAFEYTMMDYIQYQYTEDSVREEDITFNQNNFRITIGGVIHLGEN
jgi:hypothetical protein